MNKMFNFSLFLAIAAVFLISNTSSAQTVLASWDNWGSVNGASTLPAIADDFGVVGTAPVFGGTGYRDVVSGRGSTDGTFGSLNSPAANSTTDSADGALRISNVAPAGITTLELQIQNDSDEDLDFEMLHFDLGNTDRGFASFAVSFVNETTGVTDFDIAIGQIDRAGATGNTDDYEDYEFDISGISLASGQSGRFEFIFFNFSDAGGSTHLDNVLITISTDVLLGDANCDGEVNFLDISPFIALLSSGEFKAQADVDESGKIDFLDISPFIAILSGS